MWVCSLRVVGAIFGGTVHCRERDSEFASKLCRLFIEREKAENERIAEKQVTSGAFVGREDKDANHNTITG